jgi:sulfate transport system permease protein
MPMISEITPLLILTRLEQYDYPGATALAVSLLLISFSIFLSINIFQYRNAKKYSS